MTVRTFRALALAAALAGLGACASQNGAERLAAEARTPTEMHRPTVAEVPDEIMLAVHPYGLSPTQDAALRDFVGRWRASGGGDVAVRAPRGTGREDAYFMMKAARQALILHGVPVERVREEGYETAGDGAAPLIVAFVRYEAVAPDCGQGWGQLSSTRGNTVQANFGCAMGTNFAAQIANPADLLGPRAEDPADAARRMEVMARYRRGEPTGTIQDSSASGAVSRAVP